MDNKTEIITILCEQLVETDHNLHASQQREQEQAARIKTLERQLRCVTNVARLTDNHVEDFRCRLNTSLKENEELDNVNETLRERVKEVEKEKKGRVRTVAKGADLAIAQNRFTIRELRWEAQASSRMAVKAEMAVRALKEVNEQDNYKHYVTNKTLECFTDFLGLPKYCVCFGADGCEMGKDHWCRRPVPEDDGEEVEEVRYPSEGIWGWGGTW